MSSSAKPPRGRVGDGTLALPGIGQELEELHHAVHVPSVVLEDAAEHRHPAGAKEVEPDGGNEGAVDVALAMVAEGHALERRERALGALVPEDPPCAMEQIHVRELARRSHSVEDEAVLEERSTRPKPSCCDPSQDLSPLVGNTSFVRLSSALTDVRATTESDGAVTYGQWKDQLFDTGQVAQVPSQKRTHSALPRMAYCLGVRGESESEEKGKETSPCTEQC